MFDTTAVVVVMVTRGGCCVVYEHDRENGRNPMQITVQRKEENTSRTGRGSDERKREEVSWRPPSQPAKLVVVLPRF